MKTFEKSFIKRKPLGKASAKETFRKSLIKAQSAMEYLMTYGWAILIIAVVLGALFQLGVFNANNFAPKAPPGSCQVFKPDGPYTTSFINLEGVCSGELPQYVGRFNGFNAYVVVSGSPLLSPPNFTVVFWVQLPVPDRQWAGIVDRGRDATPRDWYFLGPNQNCGNGQGIIFSENTTELCYNWGNPYWHFVAGVYNNTSHTEYLYVDGVLRGSSGGGPTRSAQEPSYPLVIGARSPNFGAPFNGSIANVQIYNTSLSANEIQALYLEGIGGTPIDLQHLVGWWPLNGNANDYSGNGNNGQINNVNFVSNWWSGYTPP